MELAIAAAVTLFVTIDPIGVGPIFVALTSEMTAEQRRRIAIKGSLVGAAILYVFAFVGEALLRALGIGFPAFLIAGGILLLLLAIDMVFARPSGIRATTPPEQEEAAHRHDISVFPLAIPLIAGPGAMTSLVLLLGKAEGDRMAQLTVFAILTVVLGATYLVLRVATRVTRLLGVTGTNVISRVLGILLAALACQFVLDGLRQSRLSG